MKRIIVGIVATCLCVIANAQIQTKFWGLELSKYYLSLSDAKEIISDRCAYAMIEDNSISATNGSFGGYDWNFIEFDFMKRGNSYPVLYNVEFSSYHQSYDSAKSKYDLLFRSLSGKYGIPYSDDDNYEDVSHLWSDNTLNRCVLRIIKGESKGGDILWYVLLTYYDWSYLEQSIKQTEDEL